jgi:hypothetical protein
MKHLMSLMVAIVLASIGINAFAADNPAPHPHHKHHRHHHHHKHMAPK